jgi:hypothetical protein
MSKQRPPKYKAPADQRIKEKSYWAITVHSGEVSLYAFENPERRGALYFKFTELLPDGTTRRPKRAVPGNHTVRGPKGGIDDAKVETVTALLNDAVARLALGQEPFPSAVKPPAAPVADAPPSDELTLSAAFDRALDLKKGKYATASLRYQEVARARQKVERILGADTSLSEAVAASSIRQVWSTLADEYVHDTISSIKCGVRQTEVTIDALYSVTEWLVEEEQVPVASFKRIKQWRAKLKQVWAEITGENVNDRSEEDLPRHTPAEMQQLFSAVVDPRRRLFLALARTCPEGALALARWSGIAFGADGRPTAITLQWEKRRRTKGVKRSECATRPETMRVVLDEHQSAAVMEAMATVLSALEAARRDGRIADYPLFPAGPLAAGVALADAAASLTMEGRTVLAIDERLALAFHLGGQQRLGQVLRCTRRSLKLPGVDETANARTPEHGVLTPPSRGKKTTKGIALTASERRWIDDVLTWGYLAEFEAAYRAGRIKDYPLFPEQRLVRGLAVYNADAAPIGRTAALKMWRRLEEVVGIPYVKGRGWYGVRRVSTDLAEDLEVDERVQNEVMANTKATRRKHYQQRNRAEIAQRATELRVRLRGEGSGGSA